MSTLTLKARAQSWPLAKPFRISRGVKTIAETVIVEISDGLHSGFGECTPYPRYGENVKSVLDELIKIAQNPGKYETTQAVQEALPAGAARNALDCARIDFEAKRSGIAAAQRYDITLAPCDTAFTLSLDDPHAMFKAAKAAQSRPVLKIKLGAGIEDVERLAAVRKGAPDARLIVDANEGWTGDEFDIQLKACIKNRVGLIEQPLPADDDDALLNIKSPIPLCADESLHTRAELDHIIKRYNAINIKLDKTGGLTEAFAVYKQARQQGLVIMVGCMVASSLAMAPALLIAQRATWVDLDGPLLLADDINNALTFNASTIDPPSPKLWG